MPVLCIILEVSIPHDLVVLQDGDPILFVLHFFTTVCPGTWRDELFDRNHMRVEVLESQQPVLITKYAFVKNSGGPGKNRGGMALVRGYRLLEKEAELVMRSDRRSITPYGLKGGLPGTPSWNIIRSGKNQTLLPVCPMSSIKMVENDEFIHIQAGGGGFGDPLQRDPNKVLNDFLNGLIDKDYAEQVYGVVIFKNAIMLEKTVSKRKILKKDKNYKIAHFKLCNI